MQSGKIKTTTNKKSSAKNDNVKPIEQEKEKGKWFGNKHGSKKQSEFLKKKRQRPQLENKCQVKKITLNKNAKAKNKQEDKKHKSHSVSNPTSSQNALINRDENYLINIPIHINLSDSNSENERDAEIELVVNDAKSTQNESKTFASDTQITELKHESDKSKSSNFKRRNAIISQEFFTQANKTRNKSSKIEKDIFAEKEKSKESTNSSKASSDKFESNTQEKITDIKPIKNKLKASDFKLQSNRLKQGKQRHSNKDISNILKVKNEKKEIETSSISNYPQANSLNYSRSSEKTPHFFKKNSIEVESEKSSKKFIFSPPGNLLFDTPLRVTKLSVDANCNIHTLVEWKSRYDESVPPNSVLPLEVIQQKHPDLVCEFLVTRLKSSLANKKKRENTDKLNV